MFTLKQIFGIIVVLNTLIFLVYLNANLSSSTGNVSKGFFSDDYHEVSAIDQRAGSKTSQKPVKSESDIQHEKEEKNQKKADRLARKMKKKAKKFVQPSQEIVRNLQLANPFRKLGAYKKVYRKYFNSYPQGTSTYYKPMYGLVNDPSYCEKVDFYNLLNPTAVFQNMNFFSDYAMEESLIREEVMKKLGNDTMPYITKFMPRRVFLSRSFELNQTINMFFTKRVDLHIYHELGKNFGCETQMYNHLPGHGVLKRKDLVVNSVASYAKRYQNQPQCFNNQMFFPFAYRLYKKSECIQFFEEINSKEFLKQANITPIQYIIKIGYGAHRASGVFLLDDEEMVLLKSAYGAKGQKCGKITRSLVAQKYVQNALLLDRNNKFDFRIYMLIASTNPMIVYYHDGFLRVSLKEYNQFSNDRSVHLTNTHLAKEAFAEANKMNTTINGMNETELRDYQMWTMEDLQQYLYLAGKITDPNWLENYLRPSFMKAFIHTVRMSEHAFLKQSNVFEMYGLDFMLDDQLNLWFIECNSSPQLIGTSIYKTEFLKKMLIDMFEIEYKYYRSRMKRAFAVIEKLNERTLLNQDSDISDLKKLYKKEIKNRLEPEYQISKDNSFKVIIDKNLKGKDMYFGHLEEECVDDIDD